MAAGSLLARFGFICLVACTFTVCTQANDDKDDKGNKWDKSPPPECPPPPSRTCPPPPHPPCPPPPPKCNPGCIPAPPCRSKSCCGKCDHHCPPHKHSPPPKDSMPRKGSKRPPPKKDDDHLTDEDVRNLNDLLNVQLLLSNIYLKANTGLKPSSKAVRTDETSGDDDDEQQELLSRVFDQFSTMSIRQTSLLISVLNQTSQDLDTIDIANLSGGVNQAFSGSLNPQFNAEDSPMNMLLAVQSIGSSLLASVATSILPNLESTRAITLVSSILPVAAGQDSSMRTILFTQRDTVVEPYNLTVSDFMQKTNTMFRSMAGESSDQPGGDDNFLLIVGETVGMSASSVVSFLNGVLGLVGVGTPV